MFLKNNNVKQSTFDEVQTVYDLTSLKFINTAVTWGLNYDDAAQKVLDQYKALPAALQGAYLNFLQVQELLNKLILLV